MDIVDERILELARVNDWLVQNKYVEESEKSIKLVAEFKQLII